MGHSKFLSCLMICLTFCLSDLVTARNCLKFLWWKSNIVIFKVWWFVLKVPNNPSRFFMHNLHEAWEKIDIGIGSRKKTNYKRRQKLTHFCFVLPSNWSWSKYTHFRWNKFLHWSFELIIESCNSREAELSIADMRSSVPSVINNSDRLFFFMQATKEEYRSIDKRNKIDELVYTI